MEQVQIAVKNKSVLEVVTMSNILVGGADSGFEIGGVDKSTVVDFEGNPYITASAFKGILRRILKDDRESDEAKYVVEILRKYILSDREKIICEVEEKKKLHAVDFEICNQYDVYRKEIEEVYNEILEHLSCVDILGISQFQRAPKLIFTDLKMANNQKDVFCIDSKNRIEEQSQKLEARPRTYRVIRKDVKFDGEIFFYRFDEYGEAAVDLILYIEKMLLKFNDGVYRIGNSKTRGYGRIQVKIKE